MALLPRIGPECTVTSSYLSVRTVGASENPNPKTIREAPQLISKKQSSKIREVLMQKAAKQQI
eukprot:2618417-Amphidinium_carterae.1